MPTSWRSSEEDSSSEAPEKNSAWLTPWFQLLMPWPGCNTYPTYPWMSDLQNCELIMSVGVTHQNDGNLLCSNKKLISPLCSRHSSWCWKYSSLHNHRVYIWGGGWVMKEMPWRESHTKAHGERSACSQCCGGSYNGAWTSLIGGFLQITWSSEVSCEAAVFENACMTRKF